MYLRSMLYYCGKYQQDRPGNGDRSLPAGGDLLESGDLAREIRSRSYGDLDLLLNT